MITEADWPDETRIDIIGPNGNTGEHYEQLAAERAAVNRASREYNRQLGMHPNCQDPDHPGCKHCEDFHE